MLASASAGVFFNGAALRRILVERHKLRIDGSNIAANFTPMSIQQLKSEAAELPESERRELIDYLITVGRQRSAETDLPAEDEALVESRLAELRRNPGTAILLSEMKVRLRSRFGK